MMPGLILATLIIIGVLFIILLFKMKKEGKMREINYQVFFYLGISWIPIGCVFMIAINPGLGIAFMGMGASYIVIGLANRDKWEKNT
jgi:hypothetical protein